MFDSFPFCRHKKLARKLLKAKEDLELQKLEQEIARVCPSAKQRGRKFHSRFCFLQAIFYSHISFFCHSFLKLASSATFAAK